MALKRPKNYRRVLETQNAKTIKGEDLGYITGISYLAPANESGVMNTCQFATEDCINVCIYKQGRGQMTPVIRARIDKTLFLFHNRAAFLESLRWDIGRLARKASKLRYCATCQSICKARTASGRQRHACRKCGAVLGAVKIAVRINGTSDLAWIPMLMASEFPHVQFYDYTKLPKAHLRQRPNYRLTFSHTGYNVAECLDALERRR